jgi:hypothetical protein
MQRRKTKQQLMGQLQRTARKLAIVMSSVVQAVVMAMEVIGAMMTMMAMVMVAESFRIVNSSGSQG